MERSIRSGRVAVAAVALAAVALLTLGPRRIVAPARGVITDIMDAVVPPFLAGLPYADERALNAVLFVPLGAGVALLLARRLWPMGIIAGFGISVAVEFAQASIPGRVPDPHDVLWNTLGAAVGAVMVAVIRGLAFAILALSRPTAVVETDVVRAGFDEDARSRAPERRADQAGSATRT